MFQEFIRCLLCVASFHQIDSDSSQVVCDWLSARAEETSIAGQRIEPCEESQNAEKGHIALTQKACHSQSFVGFCSSGSPTISLQDPLRVKQQNRLRAAN